MNDNLLVVKNLSVSFKSSLGVSMAVRGVSFSVNKGEIVAILGESGCGKSVTALSVPGLVPRDNLVSYSADIIFENQIISSFSDEQMESIRGKRMGFVFQNPSTSLHPTISIGRQMSEVIMTHLNLSASAAMERSINLLSRVGVSDPYQRYNCYPHQFSGGLKQRIAIAMAISCEPSLIIADEPTTALDVTIQSQILTLMKSLQRDLSVGIVIITHDLGVVASLADRVLVMYCGKIVEDANVYDIFKNPSHPYTKGLLKSLPGNVSGSFLNVIDGSPPASTDIPSGCAFHYRCKFAMNLCKLSDPKLENVDKNVRCACHLYKEGAQRHLEEFKKS